jgi:uncharacterized protein
MRAIARQAVKRFAGMEPGRPVGGTYYLYRTLRNLDLDGGAREADGARPRAGGRRAHPARGAPRARRVREPASTSSRRRSRPRSAAAWWPTAASRRWPRRCASRCPRTSTSCTPAARRWQPAQGALPAHPQAGGAPGPQAPPRPQGPARLPQHGAPLAQLRRRARPSPSSSTRGRPSPRSSSSPTSPARSPPSPASRCTSSTPSQGQFSKVRSFVFIDGIDEVTEFFEGVEDITEAVHRVNTEADVVWVDGHSDYGHAFEVFWERYGKDVGPKTTVLLLGDARNNYHASPGVGGQGDPAQGPPRLLAQPRAEELLGHRRLDRRRVRRPHRRRVRVPQPAPARGFVEKLA